ncbi:Zinc finger ZZ-type and EF-hand domain containing protein 1 [Fusarium agapanthi]|uniref:Zinc finger ZZ-type and EF-hand domain containing protein 1 n=1 Tax=Fusarium agapanthi TaxID=1803897 RepID=A0A9P5B345_9HYPO|nr:Zinc finger ZZ-type and EF-hand domain containing protein 1 [Fusarium agapanthi]
MPFLNNFKKEFEGLNLGERLGQQQGAYSPAPQTTEPSYQSNNDPYQNQQQAYGQPPYPGQNQQSSGYQSYNGQSQQSYPGQQYSGLQTHSLQPQPPPYKTYQPPQQPQHQQWCYVETSGRSSWQAPSDLAPLPGMLAFPGSLNTHSRGHDGQMTHLGQPQYANPQDSRPSLHDKEKKSSTFLAAAGGFAAGGAAGYFVKERIDKRKAKKHGHTAEDFSDFAHFPAWEVDLECNICEQVISEIASRKERSAKAKGRGAT